MSGRAGGGGGAAAKKANELFGTARTQEQELLVLESVYRVCKEGTEINWEQLSAMALLHFGLKCLSRTSERGQADGRQQATARPVGEPKRLSQRWET